MSTKKDPDYKTEIIGTCPIGCTVTVNFMNGHGWWIDREEVEPATMPYKDIPSSFGPPHREYLVYLRTDGQWYDHGPTWFKSKAEAVDFFNSINTVIQVN